MIQSLFHTQRRVNHLNYKESLPGQLRFMEDYQDLKEENKTLQLDNKGMSTDWLVESQIRASEHIIDKRLKKYRSAISPEILIRVMQISQASSSKVISMLHKARMTALEQRVLSTELSAKQEASALALIDVTLLERLRIALLQLRNSNLTSAHLALR